MGLATFASSTFVVAFGWLGSRAGSGIESHSNPSTSAACSCLELRFLASLASG